MCWFWTFINISLHLFQDYYKENRYVALAIGFTFKKETATIYQHILFLQH